MKTKVKKELSDKTKGELQNLLRESREELFSLRMQNLQKKLKNIRSIFLKKKDIAQILTVIKEKEFK